MTDSSPAAPPAPSRPRTLLRLLPGLALTFAIAVVATILGTFVPVVGGPVFGIVIGVLLAAFLRPGTVLDSGTKFSSKRILQASIVVLGSGLSLTQVVSVGAASLPVMLGTLAVALLGGWLLGKALRVDGEIGTLISVGTGICGASAIAAVTAVIDAAESKVAYAIGTIFTFNVAAVLVYPTLGHLLGLSQHAFGLWAGTAINDTSSVVAAAYTYGSSAGAYGVVVKLTRTLMIIPISVVLALFVARRRSRALELAPDGGAAAADGGTTRRRVPWKKIVPLFIVGFLVASALDSVGAIPDSWHAPLSFAGVFMITMALSGIGLSTRLATLKSAGHRPLLLGGILFVLVGASSLLLQAATGTL
nr:putative sulfate exporter family transporter [Spelaeicoccus albus]